MGADTRFRHLFWRAVLRVLGILPPCESSFSVSYPFHSPLLYNQLITVAIQLKSVESLLSYCQTQGLITRNEYFFLSLNSTHWFLEFELLTMVASDYDTLLKWSSLWELHKSSLIQEICAVATSSNPPLISLAHEPNLFHWYAVHLFAIPVNNVVAERQFNISSLHLDANQSEVSKQASQLFVENVLHDPDGRINLWEQVSANNQKGVSEIKVRVTETVRKHVRQQMRKYCSQLTPQVLLEARENLKSNHVGPLQAKDLYPAKFDQTKTRERVDETVAQLEEDGRNMEIKWIASKKKDKVIVEQQRTYNPKEIETRHEE